MKIANVEINRENWIDLLRELYDYQGTATKSFFQLDRYCKCADLDVKFILKTHIEFNLDTQQTFKITINSSLTTDCVSLRRSNYFWSDKESVTVSGEAKSTDDVIELIEKCVDDHIEKLDHFRMCTVCRLLYKDARTHLTESICIHCKYDSLFFVRDNVCVICKETIQKEDQSFALTCAHTYHSDCILTHFIKSNKRDCPLCRESDNHQL